MRRQKTCDNTQRTTTGVPASQASLHTAVKSALLSWVATMSEKPLKKSGFVETRLLTLSTTATPETSSFISRSHLQVTWAFIACNWPGSMRRSWRGGSYLCSTAPHVCLSYEKIVSKISICYGGIINNGDIPAAWED